VSGQAGIVRRKLIENCGKTFKNSKTTCQERNSVKGRYYFNWPIAMKPNGTAVGVVCVTGAANRLLVPFVGRELSRWQADMAQYLLLA